MPYYKLLVSYDGSRFNGFQRQITNGAMEVRGVSRSGGTTSADEQDERRHSVVSSDNVETKEGSAPDHCQAVRTTVPKRPHWESSTGRKKRVACTVQDCIEDAVRMWTGQTVDEIGLRFAGRTDAGVHARGQVVRVALSCPRHPSQQEGGTMRQWETFEIQNAINSRLPVDISIVETEAVETNELGEPLFDPRHDAICKQYSYTIKFRRKVFVPGALEDPGPVNANGVLPICSVGPNSFRHAFDSPCCWVVPWALDDSKMEKLCKFLSGRHDFVAFVHKDNRRSEGHFCTLDRAAYEIVSETKEDAPVVTARLVFEAKGFQRSMVRNLVGFCVDVCRGIPEVSGNFAWEEVWSGQSASKVHSAPACGLCLEWVQY